MALVGCVIDGGGHEVAGLPWACLVVGALLTWCRVCLTCGVGCARQVVCAFRVVRAAPRWRGRPGGKGCILWKEMGLYPMGVSWVSPECLGPGACALDQVVCVLLIRRYVCS